MNKRFIFLMSLSLLVLGGLSLFLLSTKTKVEAQQIENPFDSINNKAKLARNGEATATGDFVNEIFCVSGFDTQLAGLTGSSMKNRIKRAEIRYRLGQSDGIPEMKIVRTINGLAKKLNLPNYAKTDIYEVRKLRLSLLSDFPQVVMSSTQATYTSAEPNSKMSPAEATFILSMMLQQKLTNPEYQVTRTERTNNWAAKHNHQIPQNNLTTVGTRSRELSDSINRGGMALTASDLTQMPNLTLNTLGIEQ
jgi:hypothetical protein